MKSIAEKIFYHHDYSFIHIFNHRIDKLLCNSQFINFRPLWDLESDLLMFINSKIVELEQNESFKNN